jgi:hypothetical protein
VLGPYWRVASEPEKQEFRRLFEDYIVRVYRQRFTQYRGEALKVTGSRSDPEGAIVMGETVRPEGGPPIKVDWRVGTSDGLYKVGDVIIDDVGMRALERSQFASVIQRGGGQVEGLLAMMREKAAAPASAPHTALPQSSGVLFRSAEPAPHQRRLPTQVVQQSTSARLQIMHKMVLINVNDLKQHCFSWTYQATNFHEKEIEKQQFRSA